MQSVRNLEPADADVCDLYGLTRKATQACRDCFPNPSDTPNPSDKPVPMHACKTSLCLLRTQAVKTGIAKLLSNTNAKHILSARLSKGYANNYTTDVRKFLNYLKYEGHCFFEKAYSENDEGEGEPEPLFATVDEECFSVDEVCCRS